MEVSPYITTPYEQITRGIAFCINKQNIGDEVNASLVTDGNSTDHSIVSVVVGKKRKAKFSPYKSELLFGEADIIGVRNIR